jgi:hypothetical protein
MANIQTNKQHKNSNKQPKGTLPADKLKQFKLNGNLQDPTIYVTRNIKKIAQSVRATAAYRAAVHGVTHTGKLPASLRTTVHYFQVQMSRADSDNSRDRKGIETTETVK